MLDLRMRHPVVGVVIAVSLTALLTAVLVPFREEVGLLNEGLLLLITLMVASIWGRNSHQPGAEPSS